LIILFWCPMRWSHCFWYSCTLSLTTVYRYISSWIRMESHP
jgi:hypothetical protein